MLKKAKNALVLGAFLLGGCTVEQDIAASEEPIKEAVIANVDYTQLDRKAPAIETEELVELEYNQEFNIHDYISVSDDLSKVIYTYDGDVNTGVSGEYKVSITATDEVGNIAFKDMIFKVKEEVKIYRPVYQPQPQAPQPEEQAWTEPAPPPVPACTEYWSGGRYYSTCGGGSLYEWGDY